MADTGYERDYPRALLEHLEELRTRLLMCLGLVAVCMALVYAHIPRVMDLLTRSVGTLYFMAPTEAFWVQFKVAFMVGGYCSLPFVFYQGWRFVEIGLRRRERRLLLPLSMVSFLLFSVGAVFCYAVVLPVAVSFLLSYGSDTLLPLISVSRYVSFVGTLLAAFGLTFQMPLVIMVFGRAGIVNSRALRKYRRAAIVGSFIAAAALTPTPDIVNQTLLAIPMILLYEVSIWLVRPFESKEVMHG